MQVPGWFYGEDDCDFRLFCLPPAGAGGAFFHAWNSIVDPGVVVVPSTPPGRLHRVAQAAIVDFDTYVASLGEAVARMATGPFAILGHSLGALIAFELTHWLRMNAGLTPERLVVSACMPPSADHGSRARHYLTLCDSDLLDATKHAFQLAPDQACEELREMAMAAFRDDLHLIASYRYRQRPPLECAIDILYGRSDPVVNSLAMPDWAKETAGEAELIEFAGEHMFIRYDSDAVRCFVRSLTSLEPTA